jgi:hypothetical protein
LMAIAAAKPHGPPPMISASTCSILVTSPKS